MAYVPAGLVLEHFRTPQHAGAFPVGTPDVVEGRAGQARLGREIHIQLQIDADGRIADCRYRVYGCPATIALCSLASERLPGMSLAEAADWRGMALFRELELPAEKRPAVLVLEDAVRAAVQRYNMDNQPATAGTDTGRD